MNPKYAFDPLEFGEMKEIAPDIFWLRLPLPMALDHINIYILRDDDGLTIVDTGVANAELKAHWDRVLAQFDLPLKKVVVTHYHPDHIGLAGWLVNEYGAKLYASRLSYVLARMLQLDVQEQPRIEQVNYWRRAGYDAGWIAAREKKRPFNFLDATEMLPIGVNALMHGGVFEAGGRCWKIRFGSGHAPDHATFWSDDLVLIGDHCLPAITPVISVYSTEPYADPIREFIETSLELAEHADDEQLFLPGHNRPFYGGRSRLLALADHHHKALDRLRAALKTPKTMIECYPLLFRRDITPDLEGFAISEAMAHFNHLWLAGEIEIVEKEPVTLWRAC